MIFTIEGTCTGCGDGPEVVASTAPRGSQWLCYECLEKAKRAIKYREQCDKEGEDYAEAQETIAE